MTVAIYPGTFDPLTHGHTDLIARASSLFDRVIVAIATGSGKTPLFSLDERISLAQTVYQNSAKIEVCKLEGLLINFAARKQASVIVRGLRSGLDFDYEFQMAGMNRTLDANIETVFLTPSAEYGYLSSTLVREVACLKGDISRFVNPIIADALHKKLGK